MPAVVCDLTVESWLEAEKALAAIANGRALLFGVGSRDPAHATIARYLDALSGEGVGYYWYQTDAQGKPVPQNWGYIYVKH